MAEPLTRDQLIAVLQRTMDGGWLQPILDDVDASAFLNALADELAYLSTLGTAACDAATISLAPGGRPGTSTVTISRTASGTTGAIPKGYQFVDARGIVAVAQADTAVPGGATSMDVSVATLRKTETVNTINDPGFTISPVNQPLPDTGGTNALVSPTPAPAGYPPIVTTTFTVVTASTPIDQGASDYLTAHGRERGQERQANESDESYRARIRNIPDAIAPAAISQAVLGAASHAGLPPPVVQEPFGDGATPTLKEQLGLGEFSGLYMSGLVTPAGDADGASPKTDFLDDLGPDPVVGGQHEMVDTRDMGAYFRVVEPGPLQDPDSTRSFRDDAFWDDPVLGFPDLHDHPKVVASLMAVWEEANRKRAAGVRFDLFVDDGQLLFETGSTTAAGPVVVWTTTPPAGKVWWWVYGNASMDTPTPPPQPNTTCFFQLRFTFEDGSTYTTPRQFGPGALRVPAPLPAPGRAQRLTMIEGLAGSSGISVRLVGQLKVSEVLL